MSKVHLEINTNNLIAHCSFADKALITCINGCAWNKDKKYFQFPRSAILEFFETVDATLLTYTEEVYQEYKRLRHADQIRELVVNDKYDLPEHAFLMQHQRKAFEIAKHEDTFALFMDTGTGKTLTALSIMKYHGGRWAVVVPKSIIRTGWYQDQVEWYPELRLLPLSKNFKTPFYAELAEKWGIKLDRPRTADSYKEQLKRHAQILVINPESLDKHVKSFIDLKVIGCVVDESTKIKTPTAGITKLMLKWQPYLRYRYIMTGKPDPKSKLDYFTQMQFVDPSILGSSYYKFRGKYFIAGGYQDKEFTFNPVYEQEIAERISRKAYFVSKEECLDLLPRVNITREVELTPKEMVAYVQMMKMRIAEIEHSGDVVSALTAVSVNNKLRQITSGFVYDTDTGERHMIGSSAKLSELDDILESLGDKPVVIWINFRAEAELLKEHLGDKAVTAYGGTADVDASVKAFMDNKAQFLIAHPATLKYGVTLCGSRMVKNCTYAIYYSHSYNYEDYYQSRDRIYRKGQTESVTYIHLVTAGTIEEKIIQNNEQKGTNSDLFEAIIREYM